MSRHPLPPAATLGGSPDDVEAQFYEALQRGDLDRMMAVWADDDEIVCIHPGGPRVVGPIAIRASFEAVFAQGGVPVQPQAVHRLMLPGSALHHLVERIDAMGEDGPQTGWVLATNLYVKTAQGWRLAAHHASPAMVQEPTTLAVTVEPPSTLH
ncbi:Alternative dihydrofolate reductase 3 [Rubrivivax sp. A210]|uniref:YybH family protein n=1 Tax=Rubrivivax sp. A210 TaxID=2772301 RepID=UPI001919EECE|nr:nuclear transport factor 2 family protein [Rubrivivax sp. A210]CAD5370117.1 Alternative dihydrofolate reductase 3 [Rubrivivax sp. A210]